MLLRIDPTQIEPLLDEPLVRRFEMRGRELDGWLRLDPAALASDDEFDAWVRRGVSYARSLPPKPGPARKDD